MAQPSEIHKMVMDCWNGRDFDGMRALLHPDYTYTGPDGMELAGPDSGIGIAKMYADAFPDGRIEVTRVFTDGDTAIAEFVASGTHGGELMGIAPTGKPVQVRVCNIMQLRDGKVHREREYLDMMSVMAQIGAIPAPGQAVMA